MSYQQAVHREFNTLSEWLAWIASIHPAEIVLGLERVREVSKRLQLAHPSCPVITVGGTNGKGSCVAILEKIYLSQGYRVGAFTSPILFRHNEYVRIQGKEVSDELFCKAYAKIEKARGEITLTPFEYHTLAAFDIFHHHALDVWILEVGLGGRLDAVNIIDADVAIVTSIDIDHVDWLGNTRELIGKEKAGIFRQHKKAICGDFMPPSSLIEYAKELETQLFCHGQDFGYTIEENSWSWWGKEFSYPDLPFSQLAVSNMSIALMAIELLQSRLPVLIETIYQSIKNISLPGRIEIVSRRVTHVFDVAHNPAAVGFLSNKVKKMKNDVTRAVFSMLGDKDITGSIRTIKNNIDEWYVAPLAVKRGASAEKLLAAFGQENVSNVKMHSSIMDAYDAAFQGSNSEDVILIFGSFHTVAEVTLSL